jgi:hypothetical protein
MNPELQVLRRNMQIAPEEWLDQLVTERVVALVESQGDRIGRAMVAAPAGAAKQPEAPWRVRLWCYIARLLPHAAIVRAPRLPRPSA